MKKRMTSNDVLNEIGFTQREKEAFKDCVKFVMYEISGEGQKPAQSISEIIEGVVKNENSED